MTVCEIIAAIAPNTLPSSRFIAAIAATHGIYKSVNAIKLNAESGDITEFKTDASCASVAAPVSTDKVLITASFAVNPVISEVAILQSSNPKGLNIGATKLPITASML